MGRTDDITAAFDQLAAEEENGVKAAPVEGEEAEIAKEQASPEVEAEIPAAKVEEKKALPPKEAAPEKVVSKRKAPESWKPTIREKFGALPDDVQEEVLRRETHTDKVLRESAEARRLHQEFNTVMSPYLAHIQAENATPMQAISSLMNTAYILRSAQPAQKANLVADLIFQYNVHPELLDQALAARVQGRPAPFDPVMQAIDARLKPVTDFMTSMQGAMNSSNAKFASEAENEFNAFANDAKNEFFSDVRMDMATLLDQARAVGAPMTLQAAYDRAILLHPEISKVVEDRKLKQAAAQRSAAAAAAKKAGASVGNGAPSSSGGGGQPASPKLERRSAIEAAFDQHAESQ